MAKLTVFFKDKAIHSGLFENGIVHIGRDKTNDIAIDSLAVAPTHAVMVIRDGSSTIKQLNDDFPLQVNGKIIKEAVIQNNDTISLGKHDIVFTSTEAENQAYQFENPPNKDLNTVNPIFGPDQHIPAANLQILDGENIGKIIPIKKTMIQLGRNGSGIVVITKRKEGYFVSTLENIGTITVNNTPLNDDTIKLNNNDILVINNKSLQFFLS